MWAGEQDDAQPSPVIKAKGAKKAEKVEEKEAEEEETLAVPGFRRLVPMMLAVPRLATVTRFGSEAQPAQRSSSEPSPLLALEHPSRSRVFGLSKREWLLVAIWFLLGLSALAWKRRDWLSSTLAGLGVWKTPAASHPPSEHGNR